MRIRRHTIETEYAAYSERSGVDDASVALLGPLLDEAIRSDAPVGVPGGYWLIAHEDGRALHLELGHDAVPDTSLVSMTLHPPPQPTINISILNLLHVFGDMARPTPPLLMAAGFNDLDQCLASTRANRAPGTLQCNTIKPSANREIARTHFVRS